MSMYDSVQSGRGVSPVIGVILMVSITVILAAVIGTFALGFADFSQRPPQATFQFDLSGDGLTITHSAGAPLEASNLEIRGDDPDGSVAFGSWPGSGSVGAGDSVTLANANGDEAVRLIWSDGDRSFTLATWVGQKTGGSSGGPSAVSAPEDPGFAYEDVNTDGAYQPGTDTKVDNSDLEDGYSTSEMLVIPASVGTLSANDGTTISADGIYLAATVEVTNSGSMNGATLDAGSGTLVLDSATVDNRRDQTTTRLAGGAIRLPDSTVRGNGPVEISTPGELRMPGATVSSTKEASVDIRSSGDGIDARNTDIDGKGAITVEASGGDLLLTGASVESTKGGKAITLRSASGTLEAADAVVTGKGAITIEATSTLELQDASVVISKRGDYTIAVESTAGDIRLQRATLDSGDGNSGPNNALTATVDGGRSIDVTDARFFDDDDTLDVEPDGTATGTPALGSVS